MTNVQHGEIDGVPVFWADVPGTVAAGLVFRVGQADEPLTRRGATHLIEHLALAPLARHRGANGRVAMTITEFEVSGDAGEVRDFLNDLVRSLAELPYDRLDTERRVLRTEDQRRSGSLGAFAHGLRFGPHAYGTVDCPELGLPGATPEALEDWRTRWLTRGNAALWISAPPPEGLDLSPLPDGDRHAPPALEPYPYRYPAWFPAADTYVAVSLVGRRNTALWVAQTIVQERLFERLRAGEGRSYEVSVSYDPLTAQDAAILVVTDTLPEEAEHVRDAISVELTKLARTGPTDEELEELRELNRRVDRDPEIGASVAHHHAFELIHGGTATVPEKLQAELDALRPAEVAAALREVLESALWLVPGDIGVPDRRVHPIPGASDHRVEGRTFARPARVPPELVGDVLVIGDDGVSIIEPERSPITVEFAGCAAVQAFDDGARVLWGADSIRLFVHPAVWAGGQEAVAAIDERVGPELLVHMGEHSGYEPPVTSDEPAGAGSGWGLLRRWRRD